MGLLNAGSRGGGVEDDIKIKWLFTLDYIKTILKKYTETNNTSSSLYLYGCIIHRMMVIIYGINPLRNKMQANDWKRKNFQFIESHFVYRLN